MLSTGYLTSPCGHLEITVSKHGLRSVRFIDEIPSQIETAPRGTEQYIDQLKEYFEGKRKQFQLPIDWNDMPPFHRDVLKMVYTIPYGKTRTYKQIAQVLGNPGAARAVGQANGKNRIAIVIPCHRVIGTKRDLTGYAFGTEIKRSLLELEAPGHYAAQSQLFELV